MNIRVNERGKWINVESSSSNLFQGRFNAQSRRLNLKGNSMRLFKLFRFFGRYFNEENATAERLNPTTKTTATTTVQYSTVYLSPNNNNNNRPTAMTNATLTTPKPEHIDAARLETDLMYRFQYVCKFVGFGDKDIKLIKTKGADLLAPLVKDIVKAVYVQLFSFDVTKNYFATRMDRYKGKQLVLKGDDLELTSEQTKFRMNMLDRYLVKLVTGDYDENFVKYLDFVGKIHTNKAGSKSLVIDYVHVNALLTFVEDAIIEIIAKADDMDQQTKTDLTRAFNRLLWIQNDLFARWYIPTAKEEQAAKKRCQKSRRQGMLLGAGIGAAVAGAAFYLFCSNKQ